MGRGIKLSKGGALSITYERWDSLPEAGGSYMIPYNPADVYVEGENYVLPQAIHDPFYCRECDSDVQTFLEDSGLSDQNTWNKNHDDSTGIFSNPITNTSNESDDLTLYAKWVQYAYKNNNTFTQGGTRQIDINLTTEIPIFKWQ